MLEIVKDCGQWAISDPQPVFVNKILLEHSHAHSFDVLSSGINSIMTELSCDRLYVVLSTLQTFAGCTTNQ